MSALRGIKIVELAGRPAGEYCGKLLSDFGAEVIKVEPPSGSPTRYLSPIADGKDGARVSLLFAYLNTNKKSACLDLSTEPNRKLLQSLVAKADVVVDDQGAEWLERIGLSVKSAEKTFPSTVFCSITPFGRDAPDGWATAKSLNVFHAGGWGYHTPSEPDTKLPPLKGPTRFLVDYDAALDAALCIVSALVWRGRHGGQGQFIDVSERKVQLQRADIIMGRRLAGDDEPTTERDAYDQRGPAKSFQVADGYVYLYMTHEKHWRGVVELMGRPTQMLEYPDNWLEFGVTKERVAAFRGAFAEWVRTRRKDEVSDAAQRLGVPLAPVNTAMDLHHSPQFQHRGFFQSLTHPALGEALYPTVSYKMSATPAVLVNPAPELNQNAAEVFGQARAELPPGSR